MDYGKYDIKGNSNDLVSTINLWIDQVFFEDSCFLVKAEEGKFFFEQVDFIELLFQKLLVF